MNGSIPLGGTGRQQRQLHRSLLHHRQDRPHRLLHRPHRAAYQRRQRRLHRHLQRERHRRRRGRLRPGHHRRRPAPHHRRHRQRHDLHRHGNSGRATARSASTSPTTTPSSTAPATCWAAPAPATATSPAQSTRSTGPRRRVSSITRVQRQSDQRGAASTSPSPSARRSRASIPSDFALTTDRRDRRRRHRRQRQRHDLHRHRRTPAAATARSASTWATTTRSSTPPATRWAAPARQRRLHRRPGLHDRPHRTRRSPRSSGPTATRRTPPPSTTPSPSASRSPASTPPTSLVTHERRHRRGDHATSAAAARTYTVTVNTGTRRRHARAQPGRRRLDRQRHGDPLGGAGSGNGNFTGEVYTVDKTAPTVSARSRRAHSTRPTPPSVDFTVTFSEAVTGVDASDFASPPRGVTGASRHQRHRQRHDLHGHGQHRHAADGTLGLNLVDDDSDRRRRRQPARRHRRRQRQLHRPGLHHRQDRADGRLDQPQRANPTNAATVHCTVTFSESVTGVDAGDFTLAATGLTGTSITGVTGSGTTYTVTVNTGSGDGTLGLNLVDNDSHHRRGRQPARRHRRGNGNFTGAGLHHRQDRARRSSRSTARHRRHERGHGQLHRHLQRGGHRRRRAATSRSSAAASPAPRITGVTGSGTTYTVTATTGTGNGTLDVNLVDDDSIVGRRQQAAGRRGGRQRQLHRPDLHDRQDRADRRLDQPRRRHPRPPRTVALHRHLQQESSPASTAATSRGRHRPLRLARWHGVTGSGTTYTVTLNSGTGNGTLGLNLVDDDTIIDAASNPLGGAGAGNGNFTGQTYTVNRGAANHLVISQVYGGGGNGGASTRTTSSSCSTPPTPQSTSPAGRCSTPAPPALAGR